MTPATAHRVWQLSVLVTSHKIAASWTTDVTKKQFHEARASALAVEAFEIVESERRRERSLGIAA